uniref:Uncharacterized protein n=1 Tax=Vitis vinifera TaxID=29760 RepID=F6I072_VITVI
MFETMVAGWVAIISTPSGPGLTGFSVHVAFHTRGHGF